MGDCGRRCGAGSVVGGRGLRVKLRWGGGGEELVFMIGER